MNILHVLFHQLDVVIHMSNNTGGNDQADSNRLPLVMIPWRLFRRFAAHLDESVGTKLPIHSLKSRRYL